MGLCEQNREVGHLPMMEMQMLLPTSPDWSLMVVRISFGVRTSFLKWLHRLWQRFLVVRPVSVLRSTTTLNVPHY